jgi:large subunit ribosomal protein L16
MKLQPKKTRFNKFPKGKPLTRVKSNLNWMQTTKSVIALKALTPSKLTGKQIESLYNHLNKFLKKNGIIKINLFPQIPVSKKPNEIRMGKGKGAIFAWVCRILPGSIFCEIETNNFKKAIKALEYTKFRLPFKVRVLTI